LHFVNNHDGTATISGVPSLKRGIGVRQVLFTAIFGRGKAKVFVTRVFTITVA
jgi:hypothetical protein